MNIVIGFTSTTYLHGLVRQHSDFNGGGSLNIRRRPRKSGLKKTFIPDIYSRFIPENLIRLPNIPILGTGDLNETFF